MTRKPFGNKIELMKIVVRAPNWIGDSILATSAIESLSKNFPQAQIWIAAKDWVKDLFSSCDFIKGIIPLPATNGFKSLINSAQQIKKLRFSTGVLFTNSFSSALLFYLAKIPQRWGYSRDGRRLLLTKGIASKREEGGSHQANYYMNLITGLGLKASPPRLFFSLSQEEKTRAKQMLLSLNVDFNQPLIILSPGASYGPSKRWPAEKFARLATLLQKKKKANILIVGYQDEARLAESIASEMPKKPISLAGKTSLRQLAGLISHADLFITNDSGPMHMANALKTPVAAVFGPTDPIITGPFQEPSVIIKKDVICWPCSYRECPYDHRCMLGIDSEEVFEACINFLK